MSRQALSRDCHVTDDHVGLALHVAVGLAAVVVVAVGVDVADAVTLGFLVDSRSYGYTDSTQEETKSKQSKPGAQTVISYTTLN